MPSGFTKKAPLVQNRVLFCVLYRINETAASKFFDGG
jgi:hypothetical protein